MKKKAKAIIINLQQILLTLHRYIFRSHYRKILDLIKPNIFGVKKEHFGRIGDGTYILPVDLIENDNNYKLLSFGVNDDISFEKDFMKCFDMIDVYAFDPTIDGLPEKADSIHFFKFGLAGKSKYDKGLLSFDEILLKAGINKTCKFILKMDIEGWEWGFLSEMDFGLYDIPVITIELHFSPAPLETVSIPFTFYKKYKILKALLNYYDILHVHANNSQYLEFDTYYFPPLLELTLIKKDIFQKEFLSDIKSLNSPNVFANADFQYPFKKGILTLI